MQIITKHFPLLLMIAASTLVFTSGCKDTKVNPTASKQVKEYDYKVVHDWNETFMQIERYAGGYRPGPTAMALAYIGIANYEACISGMPDYNSITPLIPGLTVPKADANVEYHWPSVVNASYAYLMRQFFVKATPDRLAKIDAVESQYEALGKGEVSAEVFDRSKAFGIAVATAVWNFYTTDPIAYDHYLDPFQGYNWQDHYQKAGDWKPTTPGPDKALGAIWGGARTFAISDADKICRPPLPYSDSPTSALYAQALETYAQNTPTYSYESEWIAEFWSDDLLGLTFSPASRWTAICDEIFANENTDLETALYASAKVGIALNDAGVACWYSKFLYNVERPQTYINRIIDPTWKPSLNDPITGDVGVTPPFPTYPSGHATFSSAAAEVLASVFGYNYSMTDRCHENRTEFIGTPRTYNSLSEMMQECAWSRVPLGVHFRQDSEEAVRLGSSIGRKVESMPWKK